LHHAVYLQLAKTLDPALPTGLGLLTELAACTTHYSRHTHFLLLQTVDTATTALAPRGMMSETTVTVTIAVTAETETETAKEAAETATAAGEMTDVSPLERDTVAIIGIMMTIRDVLIFKMTGGASFEVHAKTKALEWGWEASVAEAVVVAEAATAADFEVATAEAGAVAEAMMAAIAVGGVKEEERAWVHLRGGPRLLKAPFH
jgi:hypothetical protein